MQQTIHNLEVITDPDRLLDWIADQAIRAKPQVPMTKAFIDLFQELIASVHTFGFVPVPFAGSEFLRLTLCKLSEPSNILRGNEGLPILMTDLMQYLLVLERTIELHSFISRFAEVAKLRHLISSVLIRDKIHITSSPVLIQSHDVSINVIVPLELRKQ
ncbi:hypothetical protein NKI74_29635 [Mesorhizobium sp. M0494]|uniref:hypothetical protein n=1 Tax=Mesorhizobium sp. M0494 TaxID=2956951 RepID=UPI00333D1F29